MNFYSFSDQLMFNALKNIEHGVIYLTNFDDKKYILGSEDQKQFDASGKVIPTNTIIPTVGTDLIFKDQNQLKKVFNIDQKTKDPITEIITATTEGGATTGGDGKKPGGIMGDMWGTTYKDYIIKSYKN